MNSRNTATSTYYLELLTPKLFGSTKNQMTKDENGENASHLEITEVCLRLFLISHLFNY